MWCIATLGPILVFEGMLVTLPLLVTLLTITLALVAVYSPDLARRKAAEKILDRLLNALRPGDPPKRDTSNPPRRQPWCRPVRRR